MHKYSEAMEFERAAALRDRIRALTQVQQTQGINPQGVAEADVVALHLEHGQACVQVFFFRGGRNNGNRPYFLNHAKQDQSSEEVMGTFLAQPAHWRVMADLALLALFAGLYSVPMYALIQMRSQPTHRARIIAANNILNALFMIASSVLAGALLGAGFSISELFLCIGLLNAVVAFYIFMLVPEYLLRFVAWVLSRFVYRFKVAGDTSSSSCRLAKLTQPRLRSRDWGLSC